MSGLIARSSSYENPSFAIAPAEKFSVTTSEIATNRRKRSRPSAVRRLRVTPSFST